MRLLSARTALDGRLPSPIASGNNSRSSQGAQPGRWRNAGQASQTLAQHSANAGPMLGVSDLGERATVIILPAYTHVRQIFMGDLGYVHFSCGAIRDCGGVAGPDR